MLNAALFAVIRLQDQMPAIHFFNMTINVPEIFLLKAEVNLRFTYDQAYKNHDQWHHNKADEGHAEADGKHHDQHTNDAGYGGDDLRKALVKRVADHIHVIGNPG